MSQARAPRGAAALVLMFASGFAGLGYEIVWTQQATLWLGHESAAVLAVVAAFFAGLSVGAWSFGPRVEASLRPVRWYAGTELVMAVWGMALVVLVPLVAPGLLRLTGARPTPVWQWLVAFGGTFTLLLPATAAMGVTVPAMERLLAPLGTQRSIARLYAANTLGAVAGVLATAFLLVPAWGLSRTAMACVVLNLMGATGVRVMFRQPVERAPASAGAAAPRGVLAALAATGLLGIGYEVVVGRVLAQVTESTVYTLALLLAVYLVGSAVGAAAYDRLRLRSRCPSRESLVAALTLTCLLGAGSLYGAALTRAWAAQALGGGEAAQLIAEALPAVLAFALPTVAMGALFAALSRDAHSAGVGFGRALAANTAGAALAPIVFGVLIAPAWGSQRALALIAVGYLPLAAVRKLLRARTAVPLFAAAVVLALAPPLRFVDVPEGGRVAFYQEGAMAAVSVVQDADGVARLRINNRAQEGSSATGRVDRRQAWLPLLLAPSPRRALFLGLGTGVTASAAADDPALAVDVIELLPEVIAASPTFIGEATRLHVVPADARRWVRASDELYDVVVSDNFHPARSGAAALYTVEHFAAVRERLAPGGVFCQWLPLHQLDRETLRSVVASFLKTFPRGVALLANNSLETPVLGLVARRDDSPFRQTIVRARLAVASPYIRGLGLEDELAVLGSFVAGSASLTRLAAGAAVNTDDHPVVAYRAPRATYAPQLRPRDRLIALLNELSVEPSELLDGADDALHENARLAAYWRARDRFIRIGRDVQPSARAADMLAQVRDPLLAVLRESPDFRPAYDPLLAMARAVAATDAAAARAVLTSLARVQPARAEATQALASLAVAHGGDAW